MEAPFARLPHAALITAVSRALVTAGVAEDRARIEAEIMTEADLLGVPSHGIRMLPGLLKGLADGRVKPVPHTGLLREKGATCLFNGDNGPGRSIAWQAMQEAMARAGSHGIGTCLAVHTTHWGRAFAYACRAAQHGLIGVCTTNGMPCMAGWGATGAVIGNNPLAIAIPRRDPDRPIVLDMAMSQAAVGTVGTWLREGRDIPENWGLNADGKPSNQAGDILRGGAVLPFGGHKGAGLALMLELLTAALAGQPFGPEIEIEDRSGLDPESSKLFIAIDPQCFGGLQTLTARVDDFLAFLATSAATRTPFRWPGERGWQTRDDNLRQGIAVHRDILADLTAAGVDLLQK
ncbi:MAG: Ldh family oxidoreductase [Desulfofustis sp.]|nr:Ldh family oxidoreductase [Desulfofustis sp.]